jgi:hypothetical protein
MRPHARARGKVVKWVSLPETKVPLANTLLSWRFGRPEQVLSRRHVLAAEAGLDEVLLSFCPPPFSFYGESL